MKKIIFILFAFIYTQNIWAQDKRKLDSFQNLLTQFENQKKELADKTTPLTDSTKANIYYLFSREYLGVNTTEAEKYSMQCLSLSEKIGFKKGVGNAYNSLGSVYNNKGDIPGALSYYQKSLKIRLEIDDKDGISGSYNNIGLIHQELGNYAEALDNYFKAKKINEHTGNKRFLAVNLGNIGEIYAYQKNYKDALKNHFDALKLNEEIHDIRGIAELYNVIGTIYFRMSNYDEALKYQNKSIDICKEVNDQFRMIMCYINIGDIYSELKNYQEALKNYLKALNTENKVQDKFKNTEIYINLGRTYEKLGKYDKALVFANKGLLYARELGARTLLPNAYEVLSKIYLGQGRYKEAYENLNLYKITFDTLFNIQNQKKIAQLQVYNDYEKKQLTDSLQHIQENKYNELKLEEQRSIAYGGFIGLGIVVLLLFLVYRNYTKQKSANRQLIEMQQQLVQQEKLASLGQLAAGIAHEIQNPLNFVNNFSKLSVELLDELTQSKSDEERKELYNDIKLNLEKINNHGLRADKIVKGMLQNSRSKTIEKSTFNINNLCDEVCDLVYTNTKINHPHFRCSIIKLYSENVKNITAAQSDISRVLVNIITNALYAVKDKTDAELKIKTQLLNHQVIISITDNGSGIPDNIKEKIFEPFFTTKPTNEGTGLGLSLCYDIIKSHGGDIKVESEKDKFTEFSIILPV